MTDQTLPSGTHEEKCSSHLVSLITNQDHVTQGWIKFLITIEAGLAVALAFILKPGNDSTFPDWFTRSVSIIIPALGILAAFILTDIIIRERKWQTWYVQKYKALPNDFPEVFPGEKGQDVSVDKQPWGYISKRIFWFTVIIILGWLVILGLQIFPIFNTLSWGGR